MTINKNYLYSEITERIIKAASNVHRELGPGLVEKLYQRALRIELLRNGIKSEREKRIDMHYNGVNIGFDKVDFDVEE